MKFQSLYSALKIAAGGLFFLAGSTIAAGATAVAPEDALRLTIGGNLLIDWPDGKVAGKSISGDEFIVDLLTVPSIADFTSATVYLTEPTNEPDSSTISFITDISGGIFDPKVVDERGQRISDVLTITGKVNQRSNNMLLTVWFFSDGSIPILPLLNNSYTIAETGAWQDVSKFFGLGGACLTTDCKLGEVKKDGTNSVRVLSDATPVPLPAALPLFSGGLALLGYLGRRRRKPTAEGVA